MSIRHALTPAIVLLLALAGCGRKNSTDGGTAGSGSPTAGEHAVELTFWHIMNYEGPKQILDTAVKAFEAAHPGCTVKTQTFDNDAYKTKLAVEMASGTPPDILFTWGGGPLAEFARANLVRDLTDVLGKDGWKDRFIDQALQICTVEQRIYAVPLDLSAVLLWYNTEIFDEHNLSPPATLDDLDAIASALRPHKITPLALGNMKQWPGAFYFVYLANRIGGTRLFLDAAAGKPGARFDDPAFVDAGKRLRELIDADMFPVGFNGIDVGQARSQFLAGKAAMYLMGNWLVARAQTEMPEFLNKMDCVPFPAVGSTGPAPSTVVGGVNCGFAVSSTCKHPDLAVDLLRALTADSVAEKWCGIGRIPAVKVSPETEAVLPAPTRKALQLLKAADTLQPYYDQYLSPRLAVEHKNTTQKLFAGTMTPEEAAAQMGKAAGKSRSE